MKKNGREPSSQNLKRKPRGSGREPKGEGRGAEVATVGRDSERRKELQGAEYEEPGRKA